MVDSLKKAYPRLTCPAFLLVKESLLLWGINHVGWAGLTLSPEPSSMDEPDLVGETAHKDFCWKDHFVNHH